MLIREVSWQPVSNISWVSFRRLDNCWKKTLNLHPLYTNEYVTSIPSESQPNPPCLRRAASPSSPRLQPRWVTGPLARLKRVLQQLEKPLRQRPAPTKRAIQPWGWIKCFAMGKNWAIFFPVFFFEIHMLDDLTGLIGLIVFIHCRVGVC